MLGRSVPISLNEIKPSGPAQSSDRRKDEEETLNFPSKKAEKTLDDLPKKSATLDVLKSENSFDVLTSQLVGRDASLSIAFDDNVDAFIYRSVDKETGEVIEQWPAEDYIKKLASLLELGEREDKGQAVDETA